MRVNTKQPKTSYSAGYVAKLKGFVKYYQKLGAERNTALMRALERERHLADQLAVLRGVQERARLCFHYPESVTNFERAAFEYIAHGPKGEDPRRNGIHPFTRWGMETPEARVARREAEEERRERELASIAAGYSH